MRPSNQALGLKVDVKKRCHFLADDMLQTAVPYSVAEAFRVRAHALDHAVQANRFIASSSHLAGNMCAWSLLAVHAVCNGCAMICQSSACFSSRACDRGDGMAMDHNRQYISAVTHPTRQPSSAAACLITSGDVTCAHGEML